MNLPYCRSVQELLIHQEIVLKNTRKLKPFYNFEIFLNELNNDELLFLKTQKNEYINSSMKLPLTSHSSSNSKYLKLIMERKKSHLKSFYTYSTIIAKNLSQRYLPPTNNQNYVEKRPVKRKIEYAESPKKIERVNKDFESSLSFESNPTISPKKAKTKSVFFGNSNSKILSHQSSNQSQHRKSPELRKSLFSMKKKIKVNVFVDCYENEHSFEEIKILINNSIENPKEIKILHDLENHQEYLKIRVFFF